MDRHRGAAHPRNWPSDGCARIIEGKGVTPRRASSDSPMDLLPKRRLSDRGAVVRGKSIKRWADEGAGVIVSTSLAALVILITDQMYRPEWDFSWADHWMSAPILYLAPAALIGLLWAQVQLVQASISQRFRARPRKRDWVRAALVAGLAALGCLPFALATFSGSKVGRTWLRFAGPPLFLIAVSAGVFLCAFLMWRVQRRSALGRHGFGLFLGLSYFALGCGALYVDMTAYVGLYDHLHTFLELVAFALLVGSFQVLGFVATRKTMLARTFSRVAATALLTLGLVFVAYRPLRTWTDAHLAHAWVDEVYVGRALRRAQLMELQLTGGETLRVARVDHLARRFEVKSDELSPQWLEQTKWDQATPPVKNFLFFYVDTLRADVARDPELMPHLASFRTTAVDFERAYATGSDTLRSLPAITRGNYFLDKTHQGDLLRKFKEKGIFSELIVAKSASEFLQKLLPTFSFDRRTEIQDYQEGRDVWGYGADQPTAGGVGDATIAFLKSEKAKSPFLLWAFHFDAHAWREINEGHIEELERGQALPEAAESKQRYLALARSIDHEFGRTLKALKQTGRARDTAVVFLSDHGEGLGQGGFWVHSIFLWESLIHVPLAIRIPGAVPRTVKEPVSLVDLAPTLARYLGAGEAVYHGEDLLAEDAEKEPRRLPILLRAGEFQGHDRVGMIDAISKRKLVLRLEAAYPELHAYETDRLDANNLARDEPGRVRQMVHTIAHSPVFPRGEEDFMLHAHPEELETTSKMAHAIP